MCRLHVCLQVKEEAPPSVLQPLLEAAVKEVPELEQVEDARMGMTEDKMCLHLEKEKANLCSAVQLRA